MMRTRSTQRVCRRYRKGPGRWEGLLPCGVPGRFHAPDFHSYLDARSETVDDRHETVDSEAASRSALRMREEVSRRRPSTAVCAAHAQAFRSSALMISAARIALNCSMSAFSCPRSRSFYSRCRAVTRRLFASHLADVVKYDNLCQGQTDVWHDVMRLRDWQYWSCGPCASRDGFTRGVLTLRIMLVEGE